MTETSVDVLARPASALSEQDLIEFEQLIAETFNASKIRAPVHLYAGNEKQMISVFNEIEEEDWVFCSWRAHYQCLLKGVPAEELFREIVDGRSMSLCFPKYRIFSGSIVGGVLPIATGMALSIARRGGKNKVHCFLGDMTAETGIAHECIKYSHNHDLPIRFIIEDNNKSVCTNTRQVWESERLTYEVGQYPKVTYYKYDSHYPHAGAGTRVQF
jgi:TPP-dependent pyruvate/acetoin dehydrogenase alpha subunit